MRLNKKERNDKSDFRFRIIDDEASDYCRRSNNLTQ